jgi:hypothetical protein
MFFYWLINKNNMRKNYIIVSVLATILFSCPISSKAQWSGSGTQDDPFQISSVTDLVNLRNQVGTGHTYSDTSFVLTANLDLGSINNWTPIGTTGEASYIEEPPELEALYGVFQGNFDGGDHTISNIKINLSSSSNAGYVGLFGIVQNGLIENLNMANTNIVDNVENSVAGSIVGFAQSTIIRNCTNSGTIQGSAGAGGICGWIFYNSTISNCYNSGSVSGHSFSGGIFGTGSSFEIEECVNTAFVIVSDTGNYYVGGIGGSATSVTMTDCLNLGIIKAEGSSRVGGICGSIASHALDTCSVSYVVNAGLVKGGANAGGICGVANYSDHPLSMQNCYNVAFVSSTSSDANVGGICGSNSGGTFSDCYYDKQMCPVGGIDGADSTGTAGVLTENMVGTSLFNDTTHWTQYPYHYPIPAELDSTSATLVASTPIFLVDQQNVQNVSSNFTVGTQDVTSSVLNGVISLSDGAATLQEIGSTTLTITSISSPVVSKTIPLTTVASYCTFSGGTDDSWTTHSNWDTYPSFIDNVVIASNVTLSTTTSVSDLTINSGKQLAIAETGSLTVSGTLTNDGENILIHSGGQLDQTTTGINATVEYDIEAWTNDPAGGWYTIASPVTDQSIQALFGSISDTPVVDLYSYNESNNTWLNYNASAFEESLLLIGKGYLTAFETATTLNFSGTLNAGTVSPISLSHASGNPDLMGWNLVGNPYPSNITIGVQAMVTNDVSTGYYTVTNGTALLPSTNDDPIPPCTGFFVEANATGQTITFNNSETTKNNVVEDADYLAIEVSDESYLDRAYLWFNEAIGLKKMAHLSNEVPVLYVPKNGQAYAIAIIADKSSAKEIPLHFEAGSSSTYTLNFKATNADFEYLHLIDNYTGADIDLLLQSEYEFQSSPQYDKTRFSLLFEKNDSGSSVTENFAFVSNGVLMLNGAPDDARLQMVDIQGRIVYDGLVSDADLNMSNLNTGVYVIRLIQSDQVRNQKIIIN